MFEEEEDEFFDGSLQDDIDKFERYLEGGELGFLDSDRMEILIDHYLIHNSYTKAIKATDFALYRFPYNNAFKIRKAQAITALGQLKEALSIIEEVERIETNSIELILLKASIFSQLRDHKSAAKFFKQALQEAEFEEKDEVYLDLAMELEAMKKYREAVGVLNEAIAYNPNNEGAIYEIAYCYDQLEEFDRSINCYLEFIDENPYSFTSWYNLGNAYTKLSNFKKAIWAYDFCTVINEDFGPVWFNLGNAYMYEEKYHEATDAFLQCVRLDGDDPMAYCNLGECYEQLGELDEAEKCYRKSLELTPHLADAWLGLGIVEDLRGNTKEAIVLITKASELEPKNAAIYHVLASAYEKIDAVIDAINFYELSLSLAPTDESCLQSLIQLLMQDSLVNTLKYLQIFEEDNPENTIIPVLKVDLLFRLGRKKEAVNQFKSILASDEERANEVFTINPELLNVKDFLHLTSD